MHTHINKYHLTPLSRPPSPSWPPPRCTQTSSYNAPRSTQHANAGSLTLSLCSLSLSPLSLSLLSFSLGSRSLSLSALSLCFSLLSLSLSAPSLFLCSLSLSLSFGSSHALSLDFSVWCALSRTLSRVHIQAYKAGLLARSLTSACARKNARARTMFFWYDPCIKISPWPVRWLHTKPN